MRDHKRRFKISAREFFDQKHACVSHSRHNCKDISRHSTCAERFKKKQKIPHNTRMQVKTASFFGFCLYTIHTIKIKKTGSVNCSTIAFAAVVIFVAITNVNAMTKFKTAPSSTILLKTNFLLCSLISKYQNK